MIFKRCVTNSKTLFQFVSLGLELTKTQETENVLAQNEDQFESRVLLQFIGLQSLWEKNI